MHQTNIIPIMTCFDNNYAFPAGVAFYSLLENSSKNYEYKLYVLHNDITEENQTNLKKTISHFDNSTLEFINMENKFNDLFEQTKTKGHYSKEMFYKFLAPSIFPQYDKIIITDVDVVFLDDISQIFNTLNTDENIYLAGHKSFCKKGSWLEDHINGYKKNFTDEEINSLKTNACFWVLNLKKLREDNCEQKFIDYAIKNAYRIRQPEQDVINIICYPKIKFLPSNSVVCTYVYDLYGNRKELDKDLTYKKNEVELALNNPIQLHYATDQKPWNGGITKSDIWFKYLVKTEMLKEYVQYQNKINIHKTRSKTIMKFSLPLSKYKFKIIKEKK